MRFPGAIGAVALAAALTLAACQASQTTTDRTAVPTADPSSASIAAAPSSPDCGEWSCAQSERFAAAERYLADVPGYVGLTIRDRRTGARRRFGEPGRRIWAGSTPKLALALALREQARAGELSLDAAADAQIAAMLSVSDNKAADALWDRYVDSESLMARFVARYGMADAGYVAGFPRRWGFVKCSTEDLANLMAYILDKADPKDRDYLVKAMRGVGPVQHWGVWGAGPAEQPGVKNGWSIEKDAGRDHWITATVGFAGPDERYIVAGMYHQRPGGDSIERGVQVLTDLAALTFGAPVPAPVVIPRDY